MITCLMCGSEEHKRAFVAREALYGTREEFEYLECPACGSLQIKSIPPDLSRFYRNDYYSLANENAKLADISMWRAFLRGQRTNYCMNQSSPLGWLIDKMRNNYFDMPWEWFTHSRISVKSNILDVGCGSGDLLRSMREQGFKRLTGIDPHIERSIILPNLRILKQQLGELTELFDFIMLHHSLEHMPDPFTALKDVRKLLRPSGHVLIRLPIAGTYAWKRYGINWIGLDPPRHIFAPTMAGMRELARHCGLDIMDSWFDSTEMTLLLSEKQERGFPGYDREKKSFTIEPYFSTQEISDYRRHAEELRRLGNGDTACFIMRASS